MVKKKRMNCCRSCRCYCFRFFDIFFSELNIRNCEWVLKGMYQCCSRTPLVWFEFVRDRVRELITHSGSISFANQFFANLFEPNSNELPFSSGHIWNSNFESVLSIVHRLNRKTVRKFIEI